MADETDVNDNADTNPNLLNESGESFHDNKEITEDSSTYVDLSVAGLEANDFTLNYNDLQLGPIIGKGSYGKVYKGTYRGAPVAIKEEHIRHKDLAKYLRSEISTLRMVSHPHLIKYYGSCQHERSVYIVTEFMNGGNLSSILKRTEVPISWKLRVNLARDIMGAIAWLHSHDLIHRDIKTENILVNDDWHCVLADYGFARKFKQSEGKSAMTILGTDEFMAPEVVFGEEYDERADVYSFGLVLVEILTRRIPGKNNFLLRLPKKKFAIDFDELRAAVPSDVPPSLLECTIQCLAYDPEDRLTSDNVYEWLNDLYKELVTNNSNEPLSPRPSLILAPTSTTTTITNNNSHNTSNASSLNEASNTNASSNGAASMPTNG